MIAPFVAEGLVVRTLSAKGGRGVFTTRPFAHGDLLVVWGGELVSGAQLQELSPEQRRYVLQVDDDLHQVTPIQNVTAGDFINHSCAPNAGLSDAISLVALRDIQPGEEICFDYATSDSNSHSEFICRCGHATCRGFVRHDDWRLPELRRKYGGAFSPYLRRRIAAEASARGLAQTLDQGGAKLDQDRGALVDQAVKAVAIESKHFDVIDRGDGGRAGLVVE
jgi:hypothetical protein